MSKRSKGGLRKLVGHMKSAAESVRRIDVDTFDFLIVAALALIYYGFRGVAVYGAKLEYLVPGTIVLVLATYAAYRD